MTKKHPSGRPIAREERRNYSMAEGFPRRGFICPRLNAPERPDHDTYAVGFVHYPPEDNFWHGMEAKRR